MAPDSRSGLRRPILLAIAALTALSGALYACTDDPERLGSPVSGDPDTSRAIRYVAADAEVFRQPVVIDRWISRAGGPDTDSIHGHAWDLWRAITAPTDQEVGGTPLPVWETWYSDAEVYLDNQEVSAATSRDLDPPNQSLHSGALAAGDGPAGRVTGGAAEAGLLSFNRFSREVLDSVHQNRLYDRSVLADMADDFDLAGIGAGGRSIQQLPNTSMMLKPVWWIVPGDEPSMLPYWAGGDEAHSSDPTAPSWETWRQCILIDPTRTATEVAGAEHELADTDRTCNAGEPGENAVAAGGYQVRAVATDPTDSDFYAFRLSQDEVDGLGEFKEILHHSSREGERDRVEAGDLAVLMGMHVSTKEVGDWTWQTFWWSPEPQAPDDLEGPWGQFDMCAAYYMTVPQTGGPDAGEDHVCFNPYLETDLTGLFDSDGSSDQELGRDSNCMSCHRAATFRAASSTPSYIANGDVEADDPRWFGDGVQLDFVWSLAVHTHDGPFVGPETSAGAETAVRSPG